MAKRQKLPFKSFLRREKFLIKKKIQKQNKTYIFKIEALFLSQKIQRSTKPLNISD